MGDSAPFLPLDQYSRLMVAGLDRVRNHCRRRIFQRLHLGTSPIRALELITKAQAPDYGHRQRCRIIREPFQLSSGVLSL